MSAWPVAFIFFAAALASCCRGPENTSTVPVLDNRDTATTQTRSGSGTDRVEIVSKKKALLTSIVGQYRLESISGFAGANTMIRHAIEGSEWTASGSSNLEGVRVGFRIDLGPQEVKNLNTSTVTVDQDLSVSFEWNGKTYFTVPFKEDGMQYLLASPASEYVSRIFDNIDAETTFIDGILYLLARDRFPAGDIEIVDILHIEANSILLPYHESSRAFKMRVDSADFGDTATYTFKTVAAQ